jgi:thiol-disulfide isomerase/thioredoxin
MMAIRLLLLTVYAFLCVNITHAQAAPAANEQRIQWQDVTLLDGRVLKAEALNKEVVIVQFWASWCPFCARQNPNIEALHRAAKGRYRVLTFSIDHKPEDAIKYLREKGYSFDVAMSPESDKRGNAIFTERRGLPEVIVVKPGGVIATRIPGEMFPEDVQELATKYGMN